MAAIDAVLASALVKVSWKGVSSMNPGASALTVMPSGATSRARARVKPNMAAFEVA